jgi:hypothetical protein
LNSPDGPAAQYEDSQHILTQKKAGQGPVALTSIFFVELPGIELGAKGPVTCGKTEFDNAKRRETT